MAAQGERSEPGEQAGVALEAQPAPVDDAPKCHHQPGRSGAHDHTHDRGAHHHHHHEHGHDDHHHHHHHGPVRHGRDLARIVAVAAGALLSWLLSEAAPGAAAAVGLGAAGAGGWPVWREAAAALRARRINMEVTMALGAAAALAIGEVATAAVIIAFTLLGEYLEALTASRGTRALEALLREAPEAATALQGGAWTRVPVAAVQVDDRVLVRPGEKVPVDGVVVEGASSVTEAAITGEPLPRPKAPGAPLFAGTINGNGALEMRATRTGEDTTFARIVRLAREAAARRGRTQRLADRIAAALIYFVLAAAALTFAITRDPVSTVSVIIVAGACGVVAGTPLAILSVSARGARRRVLIKGGEAVEALARVDTVVFDKTGTLTLGEPTLESILPVDGASPEAVLALAKAVETGSDHPLARAILRAGDQAPVARARATENVPGGGLVGTLAGGDRVLAGNASLLADHGVPVPAPMRAALEAAEARGRLPVLIARGQAVQGVIVLSDALRSEARAAVERLRGAGVEVHMLTGDRAGPAAEVARDLGIDRVQAELLPEDKVAAVRALRAAGRRVCVVGDGINDAPALLEADVGVAVAAGSDAAIESAGVLLMTNDLGRLVEALRASRRAQGVILFNLAGTLAVGFVGVGLAAAGLLGPMLAAFVHIGSELAFILNSARLITTR